MQDRLIILNYNSLYATALATRLRAERIDCRILPGDTPLDRLMGQDAMGFVLAGDTAGAPPLDLDGRLLSSGMPVLAMGDAALSVLQLLGGTPGEKEAVKQVEPVSFLPSRITGELERSDRFLSVLCPMALPEDLKPLAMAGERVIGFAHNSLPIFGLNFQIEPNDPDGTEILLRFAQDVCGATAWLTESAFIAIQKAGIQEAAGEGQALCLMSGGLDSGVAALLAHRALGGRLQCLFVDTGLLREKEADDFLQYYRDDLGMNVLRVNAQERFQDALKGLTQGPEKAAAIGSLYQRIFAETAADIPHSLLVLGTSANEVLQTGDVFQLPRLQSDKVVCEPLRELFKEEVRRVGESLGMPAEVYNAQPFPSTGLALRVMGEVTRTRLAVLRKADAMFREEVRQAGIHKRLWKYFAVLYHMQYESGEGELAIALRAVTIGNVAGAVRAMPARLPYDLTERYAARVMQAFPEVLRVVNDITPGSSYSEIEWH